MALQKKDFIEIEFTAKTAEGQVFDSNIEAEIKKLNPQAKVKPFIYCLGEGMFIEGVDNYLIGKDLGKYKIELSPEKAFGKRDLKLIQRIPMKVFIEHKIRPIQGAILNFDGRLGKILSVSGGRVLLDFNSPLAGKEVVYEINIKRKIEDINEKIKAFNEFLFQKDFKFNIEDKKLILEIDKGMKQFAELFKDKFRNIFDLELEVKEVEEKK